jgi:hypothetical protein
MCTSMAKTRTRNVQPGQHVMMWSNAHCVCRVLVWVVRVAPHHSMLSWLLVPGLGLGRASARLSIDRYFKNKFTTVYCIIIFILIHVHSWNYHWVSHRLNEFLLKIFWNKVILKNHVCHFLGLVVIDINEPDI